MDRAGKKKLNEEPDVAEANAGSDPGTVVVVKCHADVAVVAVKGSRRPNNLARVAEAQFVVFVLAYDRLAFVAADVIVLYQCEFFQSIKFTRLAPCFW